jgi:hypothetical protein
VLAGEPDKLVCLTRTDESSAAHRRVNACSEQARPRRRRLTITRAIGPCTLPRRRRFTTPAAGGSRSPGPKARAPFPPQAVHGTRRRRFTHPGQRPVHPSPPQAVHGTRRRRFTIPGRRPMHPSPAAGWLTPPAEGGPPLTCTASPAPQARRRPSPWQAGPAKSA